MTQTQPLVSPGQRPRPSRQNAALAGLGLAALLLVLAWSPTRRETERLRHATLVLIQEDLLAQEDRQLLDKRFAITPEMRRSFQLTATAYCPLCGTPDGDPQVTALRGDPVRPGRTVAVSQDLRRLLGRKVYIEGLGLRVVEDLMHPRHVGRVDLCLPSRDQALAFGVKRLEVVVMD
jgi:3D (Asp-Asp-Asp) domain-containing protein